MAYVTKDIRGSYPGFSNFFKRRLLRVVPNYWVYLTLCVAVLLARPDWFYTASFEVRGAVLSYLLIPYRPAGELAPLLHVGWTLWYEMYFYVLVALGLALSGRRFIIALGALFACSVAFGGYLSRYGAVFDVISNPILFEFYAGFVLGSLYLSKTRLPGIFAPACLVASLGLYALWLAGTIPFSIGIPSVLIVAGLSFTERRRKVKFPAMLVRLGDSSYSLYLSHMFSLAAAAKIFGLVGLIPFLPPDLCIIALAAVSVAAGHILYLAIEKPLLRVLNKRL